ncbi:DNA-binding CsgD family transcriptional regulator [Geodermatophilus bullaregiensis]|uniref:helix-turn-helix transcriptional regulator n=1 Tax=Geodermatophilus bullaregiensis TaxID=1564160 RepID=UPI00195E3154|nr:LuxR family transcriptional regulator [Geodermatophilus bullaregiensis]MBM7805084.1 DNA-binding CsgD family transcriptional regulator [Geodermatophilus bullaregiensis]
MGKTTRIHRNGGPNHHAGSGNVDLLDHPFEPRAHPERDWVFVDRGGELRGLLEGVDGAEPGAVVVSGRRGVGRTRLAQEAIRVLRARRRGTEWVTCTRSTETIPLGALTHLVPVSGASSDPTAAWQALAATLDARTEEHGRVVVAIDDAHLLDDLSAALVHQLVLTRKASVVLTVRGGAQPPDVVAALWKDGLATRVELPPWSRGQVDRLLAAVVQGTVDSRTTEFLWRTSHGSVAHLRELVAAGSTTGRLREVGGVWRWEGDVEPTPRLLDVLQADTGDLAPDERAAAELLAVSGPLDLTDLVELTSSDVVASLERRGTVTVEQTPQGPTARLTEPLHAIGLRAQLPHATARHLRLRLAASASARRWAEEDPVRAADLHLRTDGPAVTADVLVRAAQQAGASGDHRTAERLARVALTRDAGAAAAVALAEALRWQGRPDEAERTAREAEPRTAVEEEQLAVTRTLNRFYGLGSVEEADAAPDTRGEQLSGVRALLRFSAGRPREALDLTGSGGSDPAAPLWACAARTGALAVLGRTDEALATAARGWAALGEHPTTVESSTARAALAHGEVLALELSGRFGQAVQRARELHRTALTRSAGAGDAVSALGIGSATLAAGRPAAAVRWLTEAAAGLADRDPLGLLSLCRARLAQAHALAGDEIGARRVLAEPSPSAVTVFAPDTHLARAWTAALGRPEDALASALAAASSAADTGQPAVEVRALHAVVRLGGTPEAAGRLQELAGVVEGPLVRTCAAHAGALAGGQGDLLDEVATEFASMGADALAADAAAQAAEAHTASGQRRRAATSAARAGALARAAGGAHSPALQRVGVRPLTARERQVAALAAEGMTNLYIAQKLQLSVRTVETHLANAYTKLGISTRAALTVALVTAARGCVPQPRSGL